MQLGYAEWEETELDAISRPKSLTELVTESLRARIIAGDFELGSQLSEARLAKDLQVSRTPVREAVNRLEMEGLLTVEPQRGSFVFNLDPNELAKLCDARTCLETTALADAIDTDAEGLHKALSDCVSRMEKVRKAGDDSGYLALDTEFHQLFFDFANNRFLNDAYQTIAQKMAALRNRLGRHPDHMTKSFAEHQSITQSVGARDTDEALATLRMHIDRKEGSYWNVATSSPE